MDEKDRFFSFERALRELKLKEDELKRLVSEGEIRAFRDEDKMKFRREDIERLKKKADKPDFSKGPSDASADTLADDLVFEEEELSLGDDEPGMQTAPISEDTLVDDDDDVGMTTEPISKGEKASRRESAAAAKRSPAPTGRGTRIRGAQESREQSNPLMTAVIVLSSVVLFLGIFVAVDLFQDRKGDFTSGIVDFFGENFSSE